MVVDEGACCMSNSRKRRAKRGNLDCSLTAKKKKTSKQIKAEKKEEDEEDEEDESLFHIDILPEEADEYIRKIQRFRQCLASKVHLTTKQQDSFRTPAQNIEISGRIVDRKIYFRYLVDDKDVLKRHSISDNLTCCCFELDNLIKLDWDQLFLKTTYRRRGYGRLFLHLVKIAAKSCGIERIHARQTPNTSKMRKFLKIAGFKKNKQGDYVCNLNL